MPILVAVSKSILSIPIPALPIILRFLALSNIFFVTFVFDLIAKPSYKFIISKSSFSDRFILKSAWILYFLKTFIACSLKLSDIRTLDILDFTPQ